MWLLLRSTSTNKPIRIQHEMTQNKLAGETFCKFWVKFRRKKTLVLLTCPWQIKTKTMEVKQKFVWFCCRWISSYILSFTSSHYGSASVHLTIWQPLIDIGHRLWSRFIKAVLQQTYTIVVIAQSKRPQPTSVQCLLAFCDHKYCVLMQLNSLYICSHLHIFLFPLSDNGTRMKKWFNHSS